MIMIEKKIRKCRSYCCSKWYACIEYAQKLGSWIAEIHIIQCYRTIRLWFWLIMNDCTIWTRSIYRWKAQTTKPRQLPKYSQRKISHKLSTYNNQLVNVYNYRLNFSTNTYSRNDCSLSAPEISSTFSPWFNAFSSQAKYLQSAIPSRMWQLTMPCTSTGFLINFNIATGLTYIATM